MDPADIPQPRTIASLKEPDCIPEYGSAQWSPDGTCLLAHNRNRSRPHSLDTFVVPHDLLSSPASHQLEPYTTLASTEPISAFAAHPDFALSNFNSCVAVVSIRQHPLRLINILAPSIPLSSYKFIEPNTEAYITPHSLLIPPVGTHVIAGSESNLSVFDLSRSGSGPVCSYNTIPSRNNRRKGGGVGIKGIVSSLSLCTSESLLAAGTLTRSIGLYDVPYAGRVSNMVSVFSIEGAADKEACIGGAGVTSVGWSPCSRFLLVAERKSNGVLVYDIRMTGRLLGWLEGRNARTNQRLGIDICESADGAFQLWAGGVDGSVNVWQGIGTTEGAVQPAFRWKAHQNPVTSTLVHPSGRVVVTMGGSPELFMESSGLEDDSSSSSDDDSSSDGESNATDSTDSIYGGSNATNSTNSTDSIYGASPATSPEGHESSSAIPEVDDDDTSSTLSLEPQFDSPLKIWKPMKD